jgi:hypothetical protein
MPASDVNLRSPVWLLVGMTGSRPGLLELSGGVLAFTGEEGRVFEANLADVKEIAFPWFYFGGGMKLTVAGTRHRISFVRPNGAEVASARLLEAVGGGALALLTVNRKIADIGDGRRAGKAWKAALLH